MMIPNTFSQDLNTPLTISHVSLEDAFSLSHNQNIYSNLSLQCIAAGRIWCQYFFFFANIIWLSPQMKFKMKQFGSPH